MAWTQQEVRELKEGRYMLIDEEPCRILSIQTSKPGKHGEAKARIDAVGLFDGSKRSVVFPVKHKVQVPLIGKRQAQVLSMTDAEVQLMDLETYETFSRLRLLRTPVSCPVPPESPRRRAGSSLH